jgi:hypothetical protein
MQLFMSDKDIRALLLGKMRAVLIPQLQARSFVNIEKLRTTNMPRRWLRDRQHEIDAIEFQWDKRAKPRFFINFRSFDHPDEMTLCRINPQEIEPAYFGIRAHMESRKQAWFKPSLVGRMFFPYEAVERVVTSASKRVQEISDFCLGIGNSSHFLDSGDWFDERLPQEPPPWRSGMIQMPYHLPPRRAGKGRELWGEDRRF